MKYTISNSNRGQLSELIMPYVKMSDMEKLRIYYSILAVLDKEKKPDASSSSGYDIPALMMVGQKGELKKNEALDRQIDSCS